MERISNYEITKRRVQGEFIKYDQSKMIEKFHLQSDEDYLYIKFIGHEYRLCKKDGYLEWSENGFQNCIEADFNEALTIYDLLCDSKDDCKTSGEYVNLKSMSRIQGSSKNLGDGLFAGGGKEFDHKEDLLSLACEKLGGIRTGKGDVAYEIPMFDDLNCRIQFWSSDEDFEAQMQILLDKNILNFMRYETVWYAVSHLMKRLKEEMERVL